MEVVGAGMAEAGGGVGDRVWRSDLPYRRSIMRPLRPTTIHRQPTIRRHTPTDTPPATTAMVDNRPTTAGIRLMACR